MSEPFYDPSDRSDDDLTQEEFESAMSDRPTPITDAVWRKHTGFSPQSAADAYELAGNLERQLAAKTEECEGWEKQWRESALAALMDKTRDELAEAIRERDEARDVIRKMELAIQHHEKRADNALSDWREADSRTVRALHERNEAREQRDKLAEALKSITRRTVIAGSVREYRRGQIDALKACSEVAESALATLNQTTQ